MSSVLALGLAVVPVGAANALTSQNAGGGLWQWGIQSGQVISNYHHATRNHTATACDDRVFQTCIQKAASPNSWAKASTSAGSAPGATNKAYWNVL
jgi:lactococcin 972 family bacteriocin